MTRNAEKRKAAPQRAPGARYSTHSFEVAIARAIEAVNRSYIEAGVEIELHVTDWSPNQLRHLHGTLVRQRYGLEAAQTTLGHANARVTEIYAERDIALAVKVASEMGKSVGLETQ